jgi:hypothetical protein
MPISAVDRRPEYLVLISGGTTTLQEERLIRFAAWNGIPAKTIAMPGRDLAGLIQQLGRHADSMRCLALSAETLTAIDSAVDAVRFQTFIEQQCEYLLIFGCDKPSEHSPAVSRLTAGAVSGVSSLAKNDGSFEFPLGGRQFSRQLAGLSFSVRHRASIQTLELASDSPSTKVIMRAHNCPVFVRTARGSCQVFVLAPPEMPDIEEQISRQHGVEERYDLIIPILITLRFCFGDACWHAPESTARLIIDDPLLNKRYGYLDYRTLLESMSDVRYGTSIAFIPWNYRRTSRRTASCLFGAGRNLSICVHGCDHTNKEFAITDQSLLDYKASVALARMQQHHTRTGLPFEPVMVFPQGRFSVQAMFALRSNRYLAAVNSTCFPADLPDSLPMADFLQPAITRFYGVPLFMRRYPKRVIDSAFDLFLGRPVLLVEHHQYFREGPEKLEEFIQQLHRCEPGLSWPRLAPQLTRSCLMRRASDDSVEVRFFTPRFQFWNGKSGSRRFLLSKHEPNASLIHSVLVDGKEMPFSFKESFLQLDIHLDANHMTEVEILDHPRRPGAAYHPPITHNLSVLARRALSEFRDNALVRHPRLLQLATRVACGLKATGSS